MANNNHNSLTKIENTNMVILIFISVMWIVIWRLYYFISFKKSSLGIATLFILVFCIGLLIYILYSINHYNSLLSAHEISSISKYVYNLVRTIPEEHLYPIISDIIKTKNQLIEAANRLQANRSRITNTLFDIIIMGLLFYVFSVVIKYVDSAIYISMDFMSGKEVKSDIDDINKSAYTNHLSSYIIIAIFLFIGIMVNYAICYLHYNNSVENADSKSFQSYFEKFISDKSIRELNSISFKDNNSDSSIFLYMEIIYMIVFIGLFFLFIYNGIGVFASIIDTLPRLYKMNKMLLMIVLIAITLYLLFLVNFFIGLKELLVLHLTLTKGFPMIKYNRLAEKLERIRVKARDNIAINNPSSVESIRFNNICIYRDDKLIIRFDGSITMHANMEYIFQGVLPKVLVRMLCIRTPRKEDNYSEYYSEYFTGGGTISYKSGDEEEYSRDLAISSSVSSKENAVLSGLLLEDLTDKQKKTIEESGLNPHTNPNSLSGGEKDRVDIITSYSSNSSIMIIKKTTSSSEEMLSKTFRACIKNNKVNTPSIIINNNSITMWGKHRQGKLITSKLDESGVLVVSQEQ